MKKVLFILLAVVVLLSGCGVQKQNTNSVNEPEGVVIALLDTGISLRAIDEKYILPGYNYTENSENTEDRSNRRVRSCEGRGACRKRPFGSFGCLEQNGGRQAKKHRCPDLGESDKGQCGQIRCGYYQY
jgi:hypothetical protein